MQTLVDTTRSYTEDGGDYGGFSNVASSGETLKNLQSVAVRSQDRHQRQSFGGHQTEEQNGTDARNSQLSIRSLSSNSSGQWQYVNSYQRYNPYRSHNQYCLQRSLKEETAGAVLPSAYTANFDYNSYCYWHSANRYNSESNCHVETYAGSANRVQHIPGNSLRPTFHEFQDAYATNSLQHYGETKYRSNVQDPNAYEDATQRRDYRPATTLPSSVFVRNTKAETSQDSADVRSSWTLNQNKPISSEEKLLRRRFIHTIVERKRREEIKNRITEIASLLPPKFEINAGNRTYDILCAAIQFIRHEQLHVSRDQMAAVRNDLARLEEDNRRLLFEKQRIQSFIYQSSSQPTKSTSQGTAGHYQWSNQSNNPRWTSHHPTINQSDPTYHHHHHHHSLNQAPLI